MIGKIPKFGTGFKGILEYVIKDKKGQEKSNRAEFIYSQNLFSLVNINPLQVDVTRISAEFKEPLLQNTRIKKPVLHQTLSFPPGEKVDNDILAKICIDFSKKFNLEDNQLVAYKHSDKAHEHIHIIANRVNLDGINTYLDSNNYYETGNFCREIETKYGLQKTKQMDSLKLDSKGRNDQTNALHNQLKKKIDDLVGESATLSEVRIGLLRSGWKSEVKRGITFIHKTTGTKIKGSDLGRDYSLNNLQKKLFGDSVTQYWKPELSETEMLRDAIRTAAPGAGDLRNFRDSLLESGYQMHIKNSSNYLDLDSRKSIIAFSKSFNGDSLKYIVGQELGNNFSFSNILRNLKLDVWQNQSSDNYLEGTASIQDNFAHDMAQIILENNASRVEADASKGKYSGKSSGNPEQGIKGKEEIREEISKKKNEGTKRLR